MEITEEKLRAQLNTLNHEINQLEQTEEVRNYFLKVTEKQTILNQLQELKIQHMKTCNHIFVMTSHGFDGQETEKYYYCIRCGLNNNLGFNNSLESKMKSIWHQLYLGQYQVVPGTRFLKPWEVVEKAQQWIENDPNISNEEIILNIQDLEENAKIQRKKEK